MESEVRDLRLATRIRIPCLVQGDPAARPVLLLHAWGESRGSFDRLVPLLSGFEVLAPDLRGQGGADKPASGYSFSDQVQDVVALLDALGIQEAFVPRLEGDPARFECGGAADRVRADRCSHADSLGGPRQFAVVEGPADAGISDSRAVMKIYAGAGHLVLWECPELVARDARVFLDSLPTPRVRAP